MKPWHATGLIGRVALSGEKLHLKHIFTHSDGIWGVWGPWSSCGVTCGSGTQSRSRACDSPAQAYGGADCAGSATDLLSCNQVPCSSEHLELTPLKHFPPPLPWYQLRLEGPVPLEKAYQSTFSCAKQCLHF